MTETNAQKPANEVLRDILESVYQEAWAAKNRGEPVGWSSSKFPAEIAAAFGLSVVYPENQAAAIAAKHGGQRMCEVAEDMGFARDICGYARISIAYASGAQADERPMPQPDFLLCCNNICNCMIKWYENIARIHNIPLIMVDVPYNNEIEVSKETTAYILGQFESAISQLEKLTGKKFDKARFDEICQNSNRTAEAWLKVCSYCSMTPSPLSGFDLFNHMAVVVTARVKPESAKALEQLAVEYEELAKNGKSTLPYEEQYRIMFEGIPCWPKLRDLFRPLKERGINTTAIVYAPAFGFVYNNMEEMATAYCKAPNSVCKETGIKWREDICRENSVDGILVNYNRSCKPWSGYMPVMERRFREDLGIPVVGFDGDQADPRNFSTEQYVTRVDGLYELMKNNKKTGVGE